MKTAESSEIVVVGAGPAGCAAAITLARAGKKVTLCDRAEFPRDKACGDGLTTGALRRLQALGLDPRKVRSFRTVQELAVRSPSGRVVRLGLAHQSGCYAAVARRTDLDAELLNVARYSGIDVREKSGVTAINTEGSTRIRLHTEGESVIDARFVIAADGAWSSVRRLIDSEASTDQPGWIAFRAYAVDVDPRALESLWVDFDTALLPGYLWSFPVGNGDVNIGICMQRGPSVHGAQLASAWNESLKSPFLTSLLGQNAVLEARARSWPIPSGIDRRNIDGANGRVLFVGDAAGAADPFTGEGIAQALETGTLAAESILQIQDGDPIAVARRYRTKVDSGIAREQKIARVLSSGFSGRRGANAAIAIGASTELLRRNIGRWLFEDFPRTVAIRPSMWRRSTFDTRPAYDLEDLPVNEHAEN